jgi:uncharacterized integral membrane protein
MHWRWIFVLVLLVLLVIFTAQNYEVVRIKFLLWSFETSRAIVIFATLVTGVLIGWVTSLVGRKD